ncbi:MAG: winged helix-turn-helix domain-containing protein [Candidatus Hodarchaeota archaeon]
MIDQNMINERKILYDYWDEIPAMKFFDVGKEYYSAHPSRPAILRILKEGLIDNNLEAHSTPFIRHALNTIEIQRLLNERKDIKISRTNLYFHLNTLEKIGLIKVVTTILEGPHKRNKTKYYGRVARNLFVGSLEISAKKHEGMFLEFRKLANCLNIELPYNYSKLPEYIVEMNQNLYQRLAKWLIKNEELIIKENLEMSELFDFLKFIIRINPIYFTNLKDISKTLQNVLNKTE